MSANTTTQVAAPQSAVWKTIKLGTGLKTADDFRRAIRDAGMRIGSWGNDILGKPAFMTVANERDVDLVVVKVADLGVRGGATRRNIYAKARELGCELCPAEVGPQLRLQYTDQPRGEWLIIAMDLIGDSDGCPFVFGLEGHDGELWLHGYADPEGVWNSDLKVVFVRPRK